MNGLLLSVSFGLFLLSLHFAEIHGKTQCLDNSGNPVDWFIIYKSNRIYTFYYMDDNQKSWTYIEANSGKTLDLPDQAVGHTLKQIYDKKSDMQADKDNFLFGMYSDQVTKQGSVSSSFGHSKGVVAFDENSGFWLVHSIPCFPTLESFSIGKYCKAEKTATYAQTMLCISVDTDSYMDLVGRQLRFNDVNVYEKYAAPNFQNDTNFGNITAVLTGGSKALVRNAPYKSIQPLQTLKGKTFQSYAKCNNFNKDLYADFVMPDFGDDLYVETWRRHNKLPSSQNGLNWVYNIEQVKIEIPNNPNAPILELRYTQDHSKWAVTGGAVSNWTCIGDINKEGSQYHRGGGTVCVQDDEIWDVFKKMVFRHEPPSAGAGSTTTVSLPSQLARLQLTTNNPNMHPQKRRRLGSKP